MESENPTEQIEDKTGEESPEYIEDPILERLVLIFLVVFLIALIVIPADWFLKLSMWWNGIQ